MHLPDWACHDEDYAPQRDREAFLSRSLLRVMGVLASLRAQGRRCSRVPAAAALMLLGAWIVITAFAQAGVVLLVELATILVCLACLDGTAIRRILGGALGAAAASLLLVLPALVVGMGGARVLLLPCKTFLTMTAVLLFAAIVPWHAATRALERFHVPEIVIFLLDTTLRSIYLLGTEARAMLTALELRSVGRNRRKRRALGGILGSLFLRSQRLSQETYEAMTCRCFTGAYGTQQGAADAGKPSNAPVASEGTNPMEETKGSRA
ncbi:energy-coupling factor transporter transmembrane component T [Selenomonas sp.]|uniref:energy-coupling factor transporter transmembrane component T n=1 Tax=Selenomonas sp. TaxID=2053611 RepID=UPI0025DF23EF|nr:energy-coupling factor transporter transmembrane component T [Selenomonas sp.]MCI6283239.1 energy-coupling factor transporter transmembrane protein EcfT [Selenomonas sp.]